MLKVGDSFGDYRVVRLLGKGGMGEVWQLESVATGEKVAAKILDPAMASDHESRRRFLREAQLAMGVKHPNIVETYDVGEDPESGLCYILMEYVGGGTLADLIRREGALPMEDAITVIRAMAGVLDLARANGVVHRDIKPANIMFSDDGLPKLADLGIARAGTGTDTTTVTQTGVMIGTPAYMAPEQMLDAHHVDIRADIYSLGVVFFEMLTGVRPNKDDTVVQLLAKAMKGEPLPDVRTLRPEISASVAQLINLMVAPDKTARLSAPARLMAALDDIESGREIQVPATAPVAQPQSQPKTSEKKVRAQRARESANVLNAARSPRRRFPIVGALFLTGLLAVGYGVYKACSQYAAAQVERAGAKQESPKQKGVTQSVEKKSVASVPESKSSEVLTATEKEMAVIPEKKNTTEGVQQESKREEKINQIDESQFAAEGLSAYEIEKLPTKTIDMAEAGTLEFVECPAGSFTMGYRYDPQAEERLINRNSLGREIARAIGESYERRVKISRPFWFAKTPLTWRAFKALTGVTNFDAGQIREFWPDRENAIALIGGDDAIANVTFHPADLVVRILNERFADQLPKGYVFRFATEAEWEYASKANSTFPRDPCAVPFIRLKRPSQWADSYEDMREDLVKRGVTFTAHRWDSDKVLVGPACHHAN